MKKMLLIILTAVILIPGIVYAEDLNVNLYLYNGSYGEDIKLLQTKLNEASHCNLEIDGIFGNLTDSCVRKFQEMHGLQVDGIAGYKTITKLNSLTSDATSLPQNSYANTYHHNIPQYVVVNANSLNVRNDAGDNNDIITTVKKGSVYAIYGSKMVDGIYWYRISVNNKFGYINSRFTNDTFILIDISDERLIYYRDGKSLFKSDISVNNKIKTGCYTYHVSSMKNDFNLEGLVNMSSSDANKLVNYLTEDTKIVVRN